MYIFNQKPLLNKSVRTFVSYSLYSITLWITSAITLSDNVMDNINNNVIDSVFR